MMSGFLFAMLELTQDHTTQEKKGFCVLKKDEFREKNSLLLCG